MFIKNFEVFAMSIFSDRLKIARKAKNITQKAMAERLGIQETSYQLYEYGKREPNHANTVKIADILDVSLDYLLGRSDSLGRQ